MGHASSRSAIQAAMPFGERGGGRSTQDAKGRRLGVVGLFAGIGGIELGLHHAGHRAELLCEVDPGARGVLAAHFPDVPLVGDVREVASLPDVDVVAAGFPCQDLSQAGLTAGIDGRQSSLVNELFRLLEDREDAPRWLLLENVPFMLRLQRGRAMEHLAGRLEAARFSWAYRIVDAQCFGLPQRRRRVILLASRTEDPRRVLLSVDSGVPPGVETDGSPRGFYWTEGNTGLGWAIDAVPTLKGGSTIGIPSPPAIWMKSTGGEIVCPEIRDAERLQGFPAGWTEPAVSIGRVRDGMRWRLVGNAVCVPLARWIGQSLNDPSEYDDSGDRPLEPGAPWPASAWGMGGERFASGVSAWPVASAYRHLGSFLEYPTRPLSPRASKGFLGRASRSSLRFEDGFLGAVEEHVRRMNGTSTTGS